MDPSPNLVRDPMMGLDAPQHHPTDEGEASDTKGVARQAAADAHLNWLFVDLNSYFASVEQEVRPELRGRPVGVVPMMAATTVCIGAS